MKVTGAEYLSAPMGRNIERFSMVVCAELGLTRALNEEGSTKDGSLRFDNPQCRSIRFLVGGGGDDDDDGEQEMFTASTAQPLRAPGSASRPKGWIVSPFGAVRPQSWQIGPAHRVSAW